jgi:phosphohistidine phosphatase
VTLYFLRHAIALDRAKWHQKDSDRPLTPEGLRKMRKAAKGLKHLKLKFDWILTSPYRRAYDTARVVAKTLKAEKKLKVIGELASSGDPKSLVRHLAQDYLTKDSVLLVGHEPYLSRLVSVLIGAEKPLDLDFKKGGLCRLDADSLHFDRCATLEWWLPPKLLRRLS